MAEETPLKMLEKDHRKVEELFDKYNGESDEDEKEELMEKICKELEIHMQLEEEMVYPLIEKNSDEASEMIQHSRDEHQEVKDIISRMRVDDEFEVDDESMQELQASVKKHVNEEESKVFTYADDNLKDELGLALSAKMLAMKEKLRFQK